MEEITNLSERLKTTSEEMLTEAYEESYGKGIRAGSAVYQLMIKQFAALLNPVITYISNILSALNIYLNSQYEKFYDILASVYLQERNPGQHALCSVRFGFNMAMYVSIPSGTQVSTVNGLVFVVMRNYEFTGDQLTNINGNYYTPVVEASALSTGIEYNGLAAYSIINTTLSAAGLVDVFNPTPTYGGVDRETNDELVQRIKSSISSRTLSTLCGIENIISNNFPNDVGDIKLISYGDDEMERDIVYATAGDGGAIYDREDFSRKIASSIIECRSIALKDLNDSLSPEITMSAGKAAVPNFNVEYEQDDYYKINCADGNVLSLSSVDVFAEDWKNADLVNDLTPWLVSESNAYETVGQHASWRKYTDYVYVDRNNGLLLIGSEAVKTNIMLNNTFSSALITSVKDRLGANLANNAPLESALNSAVTQHPQEGRIGWFSSFSDYIGSIFSDVVLDRGILTTIQTKNNYSPVIQVDLQENKGIIITGDFTIIDDDATNMRPLYITNFRNSAGNGTQGNPLAHDGYGIAIIRSTNTNIPNVFITDNNSLTDQAFIMRDYRYEGDVFENYLAGRYLEISQNTHYRFEMIYGSSETGIPLEVRIWPYSELRPVAATLSYGAYVPMNLRETNIFGVPQTLNPIAFGFGIMRTDGFNWSIGPVKICSQENIYNQTLFKLDTTMFSGNIVDLLLEYRGSGSDNGVEKNGAIAKIIDFNDPEHPVWETMSENNTADIQILRRQYAVERYSDADHYMFILASSKYRHDYINNIPTKLDIGYVAIDKMYSGFHVGSCVDAYLQIKSTVCNPESEGTVDILNTSNIVQLNEQNGFISPITRVTRVQILSDGEPIGDLVEYTDYRVFIGNRLEAGSVRENKYLMLSDAVSAFDLRITYRNVPRIAEIQSYIENQTIRPSGVDILVKTKRLKFIKLTLVSSYKGADLIEALRNYIYETKKIQATQIALLTYQYGEVSVSNINIECYYYDVDGNKITASSSLELERSDIETFIPETITIN